MRHLRLEAEAEAWPIYSPAAFRVGEVRMNTAVLREGLAERLSRYGSHAFATDPADAVWGQNNQTPVWKWLMDLAQKRVRIDGAVARLNRDSSEPMGWAEVRWRFLSLRIPADIVLAAFAADKKLKHIPSRVDLLHPLLRSDAPTAHLHLHLGGTGSTANAWSQLRDRLVPMMAGGPEAGDPLTVALRPDSGLETKPRVAGERLSWTEAIVRALLAEVFLRRYLATPTAVSLEKWLADAAQTTQSGAEFGVAIWELIRGRCFDTSDKETHERLIDFLKSSRSELDGCSDENKWNAKNCVHLLQSALQKLNDPTTKDPWLEGLVVQLIRVRCWFHQVLVMDPSVPGLHAFRHRDKLAKSLSPREEDWGAPEVDSRLRVKSVEIRFTPPQKVSVKHVEAIEKRSADGIERAWVVHLSRSLPDNATGSTCPWPEQFQKAKEKADQFLLNIKELHTEKPGVLRWLRGFDLAGEETDGPLWLFAPILKHMRVEMDNFCGEARIPGPGMTVHVGESFRHLASGLRAVHEPLLFDLVRDGDRLGHALALGVEPKKWVERNPKVWVRRWDRLLDLGWYRRAAIALQVSLEGGEYLWIQEEERKLWSGLADAGHDSRNRDAVSVLEQLARFTCDDLMALHPESPGPVHPLKEICENAKCWKWANSLTSVETAQEASLLSRLQGALSHQIAARQLVIEVNPSSNLLIADLDFPLEQPMFHLRPVDLRDMRALPVCISADDPLTFATCLEDEVAYAWAGMVCGKVPAGYARAWIDEALQTAWRGRFTLA